MSRAAKLISHYSLHLISPALVILFLLFYVLGSTKESFAQDDKITSIPQAIAFLPYQENLLTQSHFHSRLINKETIIPFSVRYEDDPSTNIGTFQTIQEGRVGKEVKTIKITYYRNDEFTREIIEVKREEPRPKIIKKGTKEMRGKIETPYGEITYKAKLKVWATSYDKHCVGCNETTATGMKAGYGVIAVDPSVIPLGSKVYIPGYGLAIAGDVGGDIKGAMVDLGFDDVKSGWWSARFTDLYILQ